MFCDMQKLWNLSRRSSLSRRSFEFEARKRSNGKVRNDNFFQDFSLNSTFWVWWFELSHAICKIFRVPKWILEIKRNVFFWNLLVRNMASISTLMWIVFKWHTWNVQILTYTNHTLRLYKNLKITSIIRLNTIIKSELRIGNIIFHCLKCTF